MIHIILLTLILSIDLSIFKNLFEIADRNSHEFYLLFLYILSLSISSVSLILFLITKIFLLMKIVKFAIGMSFFIMSILSIIQDIKLVFYKTLLFFIVIIALAGLDFPFYDMVLFLYIMASTFVFYTNGEFIMLNFILMMKIILFLTLILFIVTGYDVVLEISVGLTFGIVFILFNELKMQG